MSASTTSPSARQEKPTAEKIQKVSVFAREQHKPKAANNAKAKELTKRMNKPRGRFQTVKI